MKPLCYSGFCYCIEHFFLRLYVTWQNNWTDEKRGKCCDKMTLLFIEKYISQTFGLSTSWEMNLFIVLLYINVLQLFTQNHMKPYFSWKEFSQWIINILFFWNNTLPQPKHPLRYTLRYHKIIELNFTFLRDIAI